MIYEYEKNNMFVHHEITLSAFPLSLKWLSLDALSANVESHSKNFAIVGTFLPEIEIWDLDLVNNMEPKAILGQKPIKSKKKKSSGTNISHTDAVVSLDINKRRQNILVSGSADTSIILWDLTQLKGLHKYEIFTERVNSVEWHPVEDPICIASSLSGIKIFDSRQAGSALEHKSKKSIEKCIWTGNGTNILMATEDGYLQNLDARKLELDYVYSIKAHTKEINSISISPAFPNLLSTFSADGFIKLWDTTGEPVQLAIRHAKIGKLLCGSFYQDMPLTLAAGGSKGELIIWDTAENSVISEKYENKMSIE